MFRYFFLIFSTFIFSQTKTLNLVSNQDGSLILNAHVYIDKDFVGNTNQYGQIEIKNNFKVLTIVCENYNDIEISVDDLETFNWTVKLEPIKFIQLSEVKIIASNQTVSSIIEIIKKARYIQNHRQSNYYQANVNFKFGQTELFAFNNIFCLNESLKVNDNNSIIYKGYHNNRNSDYNEYFKVDNSFVEIPIVSTIYCSLGNHEITPIFDNKQYKYKLETTTDFYILKFSPKNKNSKLLYDGYFILDKFDYAIIELNMILAKSTKNFWWVNSFDMKEKYEFKIEKDIFKFKFIKLDNDYFLESSSRMLIGVQTKGNHVGYKLECTIYNEQTPKQKDLIFKDYNFLNHKYK